MSAIFVLMHLSPFGVSPSMAGAGDADVVFVKAIETSKNVWRFEVTVAHPDTGWKDYANGWDVVLPDGAVIKVNPDDDFTRVLWHPHVKEQPFTRSQGGQKIAPEIDRVRVRAHDLVDGFGGQEVVVDLTKTKSDKYQVKRLKK